MIGLIPSFAAARNHAHPKRIGRSPHMRNLFVLLCLCLTLNGCLMLPIPLPETKTLQGQQLEPSRVGSLAIGVTTRAEVLERLGYPTVVWPAMRTYVYQWTMRQGLLLWAVGAAGRGAADVSNIPSEHFALVRFDTSDQVAGVSTMECSLFRSSRACLEDWARKSSMARGDAARLTRDGDAPRRTVLLRVRCMVDERERPCRVPHLLSPQSLIEFHFQQDAGLGGYTFVQPSWPQDVAASGEWLRFELARGVHYFTVRGPATNLASLRPYSSPARPDRVWRMDVPPGSDPLYVGTLRLPGQARKASMWGEIVIEEAQALGATLHKESTTDAPLSTRDASVPTVLLRPWRFGDPVYIGNVLPEREEW